MQRRKIVIATLSLLLVGLALPSASINKAHAFTNGNSTLTVSNVLSNFASPTVGSGTVAQAGSTITVTVVVQAGAFQTPPSTLNYQRNVTVGFRGDWMTSWQNASILTLTPGQIGSTTLSIVLPSSNSISPNHAWTVELWDGPATGLVSGCTFADGNDAKNCWVPFGFSGTVSFLTGDQYSAAQARNAADNAITGAGGLTDETARGQLAQAATERILGDASWTNGDFGGAKTHYQNAQNDANAALATQVNLGGGATNAGIVGVIESGTGILLFGLGGLLAGFGGLFYLRRKPKA